MSSPHKATDDSNELVRGNGYLITVAAQKILNEEDVAMAASECRLAYRLGASTRPSTCTDRNGNQFYVLSEDGVPIVILSGLS